MYILKDLYFYLKIFQIFLLNYYIQYMAKMKYCAEKKLLRFSCLYLHKPVSPTNNIYFFMLSSFIFSKTYMICSWLLHWGQFMIVARFINMVVGNWHCYITYFWIQIINVTSLMPYYIKIIIVLALLPVFPVPPARKV